MKIVNFFETGTLFVGRFCSNVGPMYKRIKIKDSADEWISSSSLLLLLLLYYGLFCYSEVGEEYALGCEKNSERKHIICFVS